MSALTDRVKKVAVDAQHKKMDVYFCCARFQYAGTVVAVEEDFVVISGAKSIADTGDFANPKWDSVMKYPHSEWTVMLGAVESFGLLK